MTTQPPGGNPAADSSAESLAAHARDLIHEGKLAEALPVLDETARLHHQSGDVIHEAACLRLAATTARLLGDLTGAAERAERSAHAAPSGSAESIEAAVEQAEIDAGNRDFAAAASRLAATIIIAERAGWQGQALMALLQKRARFLALEGQVDAALGELARMTALAAALGDGAYLRSQIEQATALLAVGRTRTARVITDAAGDQARGTGDHEVLGQLALLDAADNVQRGQLPEALRSADMARHEALRGNAPFVYLAASLVLAELADRLDERPRAYATLATALVTLADRLGSEASRSLVEPALIELRGRWGVDEFVQVKGTYETHRRRTLRCSR